MTESKITPGSKIHIEPLSPEKIPAAFAEDEGRRLVKLATDHLGADGVRYALIHLDDGVLWGRINGDRLSVPDMNDYWTPELRSVTVQQCRVFGDQGELFIWREAEGQWRGRVVIEGGATEVAMFEESQILYGDMAHDGTEGHDLPPPPRKSGFTAIYEFKKGTGIRQIVPIEATDALEKGERVTLTVRHYLTQDYDGQAKFFCSRLKSIGTRRPDRDGQ
jgi:CRISPR-associated protein (TIGR03984 family)